MGLACWLPLVAALLGGCVSPNTPGDLAFLSVEAVDYHNESDPPPPWLVDIVTHSKPSDLKKMGLPTTLENPHRLVLKFSYTTRTDLAKFVSDNGYNIGGYAFFCSQPDGSRPEERVALSFISVHSGGTEVGDGAASTETPTTMATPTAYFTYLNVVRRETLPLKPPQQSFDLRQNPEDICFYLKGGNESDFGYTSNILVIPKAAIVTALKHAPSGFDE